MSFGAVIKVIEFANGAPCPHEGQYLESFDHEAFNGRGWGTFTPDVDRAMRFATPGEAMAFWNRAPLCKPLREDGKPNKPLTAVTVEIFKP